MQYKEKLSGHGNVFFSIANRFDRRLAVPVLLADVVGVEAEGRADQPPTELPRVNLHPESGEGLDHGTCIRLWPRKRYRPYIEINALKNFEEKSRADCAPPPPFSEL